MLKNQRRVKDKMNKGTKIGLMVGGFVFLLVDGTRTLLGYSQGMFGHFLLFAIALIAGVIGFCGWDFENKEEGKR